MPSLSEAKIMGGIGALLVLLSAIPTVGMIISIVGFVLVLIAVRSISLHLGDRSVFDNMLISVVTAIAAVVVIGIFVVAAFFSVLGVGGFMSGTFSMPANISQGQWLTFFSFVLPGLAGTWILLIVSALFLRRSLSTMGTRLQVSLFETAGLLYLIGAITVIIVIGFLLILVAEILLAVAFFLIEDRARAPSPAQTG